MRLGVLSYRMLHLRLKPHHLHADAKSGNIVPEKRPKKKKRPYTPGV
jgi:hypothetical protein